MITCDTDCEIVSRSLSDVANQVCAIVELFWVVLPLFVNVGQVSSQGQNISQPEALGLLQVARDILLGRANTGHVQHRLDPDVLDCTVCNHHARCLRVSSGIASWMPCYI